MTGPKKSIADGVDAKVNPYDESFGANAERALEKTPFAGKAYKSIRSTAESFGEVDEVGDLVSASKDMASNAGSFVAGCYADAAFAAMDPIGWLVGNGLNILLELVQPMQDALHYVSGDGPSLSHASDNFVQIGEGFVALAEDFKDTGDKSLVDWKEDAGNAAREALADFSVGVKGIGSASGAIAEVLKTWSMVMTVIEEVIKGIITELVSWLITLWLPALAASIISFGSSVAAAMTASIAKAASVFAKITKHLGKLGKLLDELMGLLAKMNKGVLALAKIFGKRRKLDTATAALMQDIGRFTGQSALRTGMQTMGGSLKSLGVGAAAKSGIGVAKAAGAEGTDAKHDYTEEGERSRYDRSQVGGDQSAEDTRKNLDM